MELKLSNVGKRKDIYNIQAKMDTNIHTNDFQLILLIGAMKDQDPMAWFIQNCISMKIEQFILPIIKGFIQFLFKLV